MTTKEYYDKKLAEIPSNFLNNCVELLKHEIDYETKQAIKEEYESKGADWISGHHFGWGMWVRNILRQAGFKDDALPVQNWDDYYVPVVELAVGIR